MQRRIQFVLVFLHLLLATQAAPITEFASPNPEEIGGHYQGDIVLRRTEIGRGVGIRPAYARWANGVVPYEFASNVCRSTSRSPKTSDHCPIVLAANNTVFIVNMMREMEALTMVNNNRCISFREKNSTDPYFITIFNGSGCFAPVGSWGSSTQVRGVSLMDSPTSTCMISGTIQHELMHVLGFFHEQSRPDRDTYVSIQWANIQSGYASAFDKYNDTDVDTQMTPYDYGSVMHYSSNAFAVNSSGPTIIAVLNSTAALGQRVRLSPIDILEIQRYYGCVPTPPDPNATTTSTTASTIRTTTTTISTTRTTTSSTTSQTTTTTSATTTSRTTSTSATTTSATTTTSTSATTATTTSATTATTTSATTTTETTSTTTAAGSSLHAKLQSSWMICLLGLLWMLHAVKPAHH